MSSNKNLVFSFRSASIKQNQSFSNDSATYQKQQKKYRELERKLQNKASKLSQLKIKTQIIEQQMENEIKSKALILGDKKVTPDIIKQNLQKSQELIKKTLDFDKSEFQVDQIKQQKHYEMEMEQLQYNIQNAQKKCFNLSGSLKKADKKLNKAKIKVQELISLVDFHRASKFKVFELIKYLFSNQTLKVLDLKFSGLVDKFVPTIRYILEKNPTITKVELA